MYDLGRFDVPIAVGLYSEGPLFSLPKHPLSPGPITHTNRKTQIAAGEDNVPQFPAVGNFSLASFEAAGGTIYYGTDYLAGLMQAATPADPLFVVEIAREPTLLAVPLD